MIWLGLAGVTLLALSPLLWSLWRRQTLQGRREPALALHRAQLAELDRELAEGLLLPAEHTAARLEVQRRLLAEPGGEDTRADRSTRWPLILAMPLITAAALALYLVSQGQPGLPAEPYAPRAAEWAKEDRLIDLLSARLAATPANDPRLFAGYVLLGEVQQRRGRLGLASDAWRQALAIHFDPDLAARAAEARAEDQGQVDDVAADLFRQALAAAPPDADWRTLVQERLKEAGK